MQKMPTGKTAAKRKGTAILNSAAKRDKSVAVGGVHSRAASTRVMATPGKTKCRYSAVPPLAETSLNRATTKIERHRIRKARYTRVLRGGATWFLDSSCSLYTKKSNAAAM